MLSNGTFSFSQKGKKAKTKRKLCDSHTLTLIIKAKINCPVYMDISKIMYTIRHILIIVRKSLY